MTTAATETVIPQQTLTADVTSPIVTDGPQVTVSSPVVSAPEAPIVTEVVPAAPVETPLAGDEAPKVTPKWAQDRINELTAKRYEAERRAQQLEEEKNAAVQLLDQLKTAPQPTPANTAPAAQPGLTEQEVERRAQEKAMQMAQQLEFNKTCNAIAATGEKEYKDWGTAMHNLTMVGALGQGASSEFLETVIELEAPQQVLHYLGTNLDQAKRIAEMSPKKMALEMARLEATLRAPAPLPPMPPVSNAPAPIIPVGGAAKIASGDITDPTMTPDEWFALRAKQVADRKSRYTRA